MSNRPNAEGVFGAAIAEHMEVVRQVEAQQPVLEAIARAMTATLRAGGKILWCGNGGSAGDSQHLAAELVGRYRRERRGMASVALTTDSSALTSIANDYGYEAVFSRQVEALGVEGDLLVGISTSGNSQNVVAALAAARRRGWRRWLLPARVAAVWRSWPIICLPSRRRRRRGFRRRTYWLGTCSATGLRWTA